MPRRGQWSPLPAGELKKAGRSKLASRAQAVTRFTSRLIIPEKKIARKQQTFVQAKEGGAEWVDIEPAKVNRPTLTEEKIEELCKTACLIERHYGSPQDIEWAYEKNVLYILQARKANVGGQ